MLIAVRNIKDTCEWHKAIKLNYKNTRTRVTVVLRLPSTLRRPQLICYLVTSELACADLQSTEGFRVTLRYNADARGHSTSGQTRTSLNHLKNVLSCVNRSYHLPFRLQRNTRKRTSITQCLVNSHKYTSRRNPSIGKTPLIFLNSSTCIAITKCISQYSTWEKTKGMFALHKSPTDCSALDKYDVTDGLQYVDTNDAHTFLWPLSP